MKLRYRISWNGKLVLQVINGMMVKDGELIETYRDATFQDFQEIYQNMVAAPEEDEEATTEENSKTVEGFSVK